MIKRIKHSVFKKIKWLQSHLFNGKRILILGDSHAGVFEEMFNQGYFKKNFVSCEIVGGATAYGINNAQSLSQAHTKFKKAVKRFHYCETVAIMLGEVDCSIALWVIAEKNQQSPDDLLDHIVDKVNQFLKQHLNNKKIIILAASLPTVFDHQIDDQVYLPRKGKQYPHQQRTKLVISLNQKLDEMARQNGYAYLDITDAILDKKTGLISTDYVKQDMIDHHLSFSTTYDLWQQQFESLPD